MKCVCGISYSDNLDEWDELELVNAAVFAAECPDCHEPGIKLARDNRDKESAVTIYPVGPTRDPIKLVGVPEELGANYMKALRALPAEFYSVAAILARKSLESQSGGKVRIRRKRTLGHAGRQAARGSRCCGLARSTAKHRCCAPTRQHGSP